MKSKSKAPKQEPESVARQEINLSELSILELKLINAKGETILEIQFDRTAEATPRLQIGSLSPDGELRAQTTLFDVDA